MLKSSDPKYRKDIDGLRAIAVLAVVFFHAGVGPFEGGYVGVDVFFVISGYLITGIIWEAAQAGRFSIIEFYERRARRILPALLTVVLFVCLFTLLYKTPREVRQFGESVSFLAIFASNHFFMQERGYFNAPLETYALLHTWSLAVEEQFYIFFPPLLAWLASRKQTDSRVLAVRVVGAMALSSLVAAAWLVGAGARDLAFYALPFRVWELALGGLIAIGAAPALTNRTHREVASALGILGIVAAIVLFDEATPFPGLAALPPCLGAALLIHANANSDQYGHTFVGRMLSLRPMVFVGLISYSLYLWHWPLLSFGNYITIRPLNEIEIAAALTLSVALSIFSFYYIERPFRKPAGVLTRRPLFAASAATLASLVALGVVLQETKGLPGRMPADVLAMTSGDAIEFGVPRNCPPEHGRLTEEARADWHVIFCRLGDVAKTPTALVWGDSHTLAISTAFDEAAKDLGVSVMMTSRAACPPVVVLDFLPLENWRGCSAHNQAVFDSLERLGVETVYLFGAWATYSTQAVYPEIVPGAQEAFRTAFSRMIEDLQARGVEVVIGTSVPVYTYSVPSSLARERLFGVDAPFDLSRSGYEYRHGPDLREIGAFSERYGLRVFPLHEQFCDAERCEVQRDGLPLYADHGHINRIAARALAPAISELLK